MAERVLPLEQSVAAANLADVRIEPDREVRIALVLYGGVSLAIYIHGVTQELLRAVRATAPKRPDSTEPFLSEPESVEKVYRELGCRVGSATPFSDELDQASHGSVRTRFVVDVVSGTSAGGINGIFLCKALASGKSLDGLRELWLKEGDLSLLLNDKGSRKGVPNIEHPKRPQALLNTSRLYYRLLCALNDLDDPAEPAVSPLIDEMDLFVTATDIRGVTLPLELWDGIVFERKYRHVFRMRYRSPIGDGRRNDFEARNNGFMAFVARCTSSFPVAFDPMMIADLSRVPPWLGDRGRLHQDLEAWKPFFADYLLSEHSMSSAIRSSEVFAERSFGDGGYLDNKPFSYATEALRSKRSNRRIIRRLFYVEPAPERPEAEANADDPRPDAIENALAAGLRLPRIETIREDIERVNDRNRVIERADQILHYLDDDLNKSAKEPMSGKAYAATDLKAMAEKYSASYATYHRLGISQVTQDIADLLARLSGLGGAAGLASAVQILVRAWRMERFCRELGEVEVETKPWTENRFLLNFDAGFRIRRLEFLQERLDNLLGIIGRSERRAGDRARTAGFGLRDNPFPETIGSEAEQDERWLKGILGNLHEDFEPWLRIENVDASRRAVLKLKGQLAAIQAKFRDDLEALCLRSNPIREYLAATRISVTELTWILEPQYQKERELRAAEVLSSPESRRCDVINVMCLLTAQMGKIFRDLVASITGLLPIKEHGRSGIASGAAPYPLLQRVMAKLYDRFYEYDQAVFPLVWGTGAGETTCVDVVRISPDDTNLLEQFDRSDGTRLVHKLAGTRFANFGGFLDESWRRSDMLWGRLDGAERIIRTSLVPRTTREEGIQDALVTRAHAAIVCEELKGLDANEAREVMCQCVMRTLGGRSEPDLLVKMVGKLLPTIRTIHIATADALEPTLLREEYRKRYSESRSLPLSQGADLLARGTQVIGRVLETLQERYGPLTGQPGWWLLWIGRSIWGLVEVLTPGRWGNMIRTDWIRLAYLLGAVLVLGGMVLGRQDIQLLGTQGLFVIAAADALLRLAGLWLLRPRMWQYPLLAILVVLLGVGAWTTWEFLSRLPQLAMDMLARVDLWIRVEAATRLP
ncbi:MAG TPA: patatin-like protein [Candidatus Eisenbacteria bacterium]|nr:patatin-like protein [Candidatus Eisenbacteria bacterium]